MTIPEERLFSIEDIVLELERCGCDFHSEEVLAWLRSRGYLVGERCEFYNYPTQLCLIQGWMKHVRTQAPGSAGRIHMELRPYFTSTGWDNMFPHLLRYVRKNEDMLSDDLRY